MFLFFYWTALFNCLVIVIGIQKLINNKLDTIEQKNNTENTIINDNIDNILKYTNIEKSNKNIAPTGDIFEKNLLDNKHTVLTSMRKLFHFLICVVYALGIFYDRHLLFLCSYGMLIVLVIFEVSLKIIFLSSKF